MGGTPRGPGASRPPGEQPTFAVAGEPVGLDHVLLDLGGHGQEELQHLAHVIAGVVPSLLHALRVLGRPERLDHLRQHGCGTRALSRPPASRIQLRDMGTTRASRPGDGTSRTHPWPVRRSAPAVPRAVRRPPWSAVGRPRHRPGPTAADGHHSPARAERACASPPRPAPPRSAFAPDCGSGFPRERETCWTNSKRAEITARIPRRAKPPSEPTHP